AGGRAHDVDADDAFGSGVGDHLHEAVRLGDAHGAAERRKRELAYLDLDALLLGLGFGQAHRSDLEMREDDARHGGPILRRTLAGDHLGAHLALFGSLVRQHWRSADVADGEDALDVCLAQLVGLHETARIDLYAQLFETDTARARLHSDGHQ